MLVKPFEFKPGDRVRIIGGSKNVATIIREDSEWVSAKVTEFVIRFDNGNEMVISSNEILREHHPIHEEIDYIKEKAKKHNYIGILLIRDSNHKIYKKALRSLREEFQVRDDCKANSTEECKYEVFLYLQV